MTRRPTRHVLVVGKFLPLHAGHLALLEHARTVAGPDGVVTVVVGPRWDEPITPDRRVDWLVRCAPWARTVVAPETLPTRPPMPSTSGRHGSRRSGGSLPM